MEMNKHKEADPDTKNPRKQMREHEELDGVNGSWFDKFPDEILIAILSRMRIEQAAKTSVLSSKWRNLWKFTSGTLFFGTWARVPGPSSGTYITRMMKRETYKDLVDHVLSKHQGGRLDALVVRFSTKMEGEQDNCFSIDEWVYFAMSKQVKRLELDLSVRICSHSKSAFPSLEGLLNKFPSNKSVGAFCSLRSLRLVDVHISDEVVGHFLASCPYIEELCIRASNTTINLRVVDPLPNLKVLEISDCCNIQSLVISVTSLVSCTYQGREIDLPFKKYPSLRELTLGGKFSESFVYQPNQHSAYSPQLVKLVLNIKCSEEREIVVPAPRDLPQLQVLKRLELNIVSLVNRSLLFFISLIEASPHLEEFKIQIEYIVTCIVFAEDRLRMMMRFPEVTSVSNFRHENLKMVKMVGYCGCASEDELLVQISKIAPSLEIVFIDANSDYFYDHPVHTPTLARYRPRIDGQVRMSRVQRYYWMLPEDLIDSDVAKKHAEKLASRFPSKIEFVITA